MKKLIPFVIAACALISLVALAQTPTPPARQAAATSAPAAAGGTGAEGKIALIITAAFRDGILELKAKLDALNVEFEPKNKEMQGLKDEIEKLKSQIQTQGQTVSVAVRNQWMEKGAELEKTIKRKEEDYQQLAQKRFEEVAGPIQDKIAKFLEQYAQQRGIAVVLEAGAAQQNGLLLFASQATNITDDFIKEYNKANPAPAAAPKKP